jgi:hypothetical protein
LPLELLRLCRAAEALENDCVFLYLGWAFGSDAGQRLESRVPGRCCSALVSKTVSRVAQQPVRPR